MTPENFGAFDPSTWKPRAEKKRAERGAMKRPLSALDERDRLDAEALAEALAAYRSALRCGEPESEQLRKLGDTAIAAHNARWWPERGMPERDYLERDYLERTIATVRNHRDADNCWPQWANIFADEIEELRNRLAKAQEGLRAMGGIAGRVRKALERVDALDDEDGTADAATLVYEAQHHLRAALVALQVCGEGAGESEQPEVDHEAVRRDRQDGGYEDGKELKRLRKQVAGYQAALDRETSALYDQVRKYYRAWQEEEQKVAALQKRIEGEPTCEPDPWPIIEWLQANMPRALELCPYKVVRPGVPPLAASSLEEAEKEKLDGVARIATERQRQIESEGWTVEHDDEHTLGELAEAAACYAMNRYRDRDIWGLPLLWRLWPWESGAFKPVHGDPQGRIRELEKAGALIAAEIDRLLRAVLGRGNQGDGK